MPQPTNKSDYFEFSRTQGLPARCPIFDRCERRAHTLAIANNWPFGDSISLADLRQPVVHVVGEGPSSAGGRNNFFAQGLCPEVQLFEPSRAIPGLSNTPAIAGEYDKYWEQPYKVLETGHFSQCLEYVMHTSGDAIDLDPGEDQTWWKRNFQWLVDVVLKITGLALQALQRR
ncbi:hypothetical protein [Paraburkholderia sp. ZP32-5]|uniref:hypothetical protein n=1 Tax=Paraburkholderia sp. ZP32-5 TaxID=2883245 RepID=UPI001F235492|nr:hypothetical protein [Paraburkholderia sp. ZP32-5]